MLKASTILGMQVISLFEGQVEGYVKNLIFSKDYKKLKTLIICNDKFEDKQFTLKTNDIFKINDVIFIKNQTFIVSSTNEQDNSPINLNAFQADGKSLGSLNDVILDDKFNVIKFITNLNEVSNSIAKINNNLIIFNTDEILLKLYLFKPKQKLRVINNSSTKTVILNNTLNYNFLLGRKVTKDILSFNNEMLIKNGTTVTERTVQIAKQNGKLRELALNI